jgi:hypothetical protein
LEKKKIDYVVIISFFQQKMEISYFSAGTAYVNVRNLKHCLSLIFGNQRTITLKKIASNIAPPKLRQEAAFFRELKNSWINGKSLLFGQFQDVAALRLRSRNPIWIDDSGNRNQYYL